jgi:hypothetical protein
VAQRSGILVNSNTEYLLANIEVCNNAGCFVPKAEKAKQDRTLC